MGRTGAISRLWGEGRSGQRLGDAGQLMGRVRMVGRKCLNRFCESIWVDYMSSMSIVV